MSECAVAFGERPHDHRLKGFAAEEVSPVAPPDRRSQGKVMSHRTLLRMSCAPCAFKSILPSARLLDALVRHAPPTT